MKHDLRGLIDRAGVAAKRGCTIEYAYKIAKHPLFPKPVTSIGNSLLWRERDVDTFNRNWIDGRVNNGRKPGSRNRKRTRAA